MHVMWQNNICTCNNIYANNVVVDKQPEMHKEVLLPIANECKNESTFTFCLLCFGVLEQLIDARQIIGSNWLSLMIALL